jgi:hypothetical protein
MAPIKKDLPNDGRTQFFNFQYDDGLSEGRGLDLAIALMQTCDADMSLLASWFSGRQLDMSPPINVSINTVATDAAGNPTQFVGGHWSGGLVVPLQVTINIGELTVGIGDATMLARYLMIAEMSEMYMRAFGPYPGGPWFRVLGEGNKGEALSRFLAQQFLLKTFPGVTALPTLMVGVWNVTNLWLNSPRAANPPQLEIDDDDINPDPEVGCATLFLFYLHDQLGFSIEDIINNGAGHLSNVYDNLTRNGWANAWPNFSGLVDSHYPRTADSNGNISQYNPPLETVFPVSDLMLFTAPAQLSWIMTGGPSMVSVGVDRPAVVPLAINISSNHPEIIPALSVTINPTTTSNFANFTVTPQDANFVSTGVTLTASYAGRSLTRLIMVVRPDATGLPPLEIDVDQSGDPCHALFVEGTSETFAITNLNVFADQTGFKFLWSVMGAVPDATNASEVTISTLPAAGTTVKLGVTVTNGQGLQAAGTFSFQTVAVQTGVQALSQELRCRLSNFRNGNLRLPPWVPIEEGGVLKEQLAALEKQVQEVSRAATRLTTFIRSMKAVAEKDVAKIDSRTRD